MSDLHLTKNEEKDLIIIVFFLLLDTGHYHY